MIDWSLEKGWAKHCIFGLKEDWLNEYFATGKFSGGVKQVESLRRWLKTTGLVINGGRSSLAQQLENHSNRNIWQLLWVNVVFNFPTARWYAHLGSGRWTTRDLRILLKQSVKRLAERTVVDAIMELAGLFEYTPIGKELGQGIVDGGRPRLIKRIGTEPCDAAILYAFGRLYVSYGKPFLPFDASLTWPWIIFGCDKKFIIERIAGAQQNIFEVKRDGIVMCNTYREGWLCGNTIISYL